MNQKATEWIIAAHLLRPQGRRGELLAEPASDLPGLLSAGRPVRISASDGPAGNPTEATIEAVWRPTGRNAGRIVIKLAGSETINDAERFAGRNLLVPTSSLPALEADTWFVRDLIGCTLVNDGSPVGEITGVQYAVGPDGRTRLEDAAPLLEVAIDAAVEPTLIPFIKAWIETVDIDARRVAMHLPEGLLSRDIEA